MLKCLESKSYKEWRMSLGFFSLRKRRLSGDVLAVYSFLKAGTGRESDNLLSLLTSNKTQGNEMKLQRASSDWTLGKGLSLTVWQVTGAGSPGKRSCLSKSVRVQRVPG